MFLKVPEKHSKNLIKNPKYTTAINALASVNKSLQNYLWFAPRE